MKKYYLEIPVFLILVATLISSFIAGPGPTMRENSFIIDGDGFKQQLIRLEIRADEFESNYYGKGTYNYYEDNQNMSVRISGANKFSTTSPITGIHMDFNNFKGPGVYTLDSSINVSIFFKKDTPTNGYDNQYVLDMDGEVIIKSYEPVGGLIEGVFSGKFVKMVFDKQTGLYTDSDINVTIKDGTFSVIHRPDYHWDSPVSTGAEPDGFKKESKNKKKKN